MSLRGYYRWHAHIYDATRWAFLFGRSSLVDLIAAEMQPRRILEIGCGTGRNLAELALRFPHAHITGLDLSAEMLAKARRKTAEFGPRIQLVQRLYDAPLSEGEPFDVIVFSYCLTMINPGYAEVLRLCAQDLAPSGRIAMVDFHNTPAHWFRRWMGVNHVRMDGQILAEMRDAGLHPNHCSIHLAYGGLWRWFTCLAARA